MISIQSGLEIFSEMLFWWYCRRDLKQRFALKKCPSVVNEGITMTLTDGVQSSFERAGVQSFWEAL